MADLDPSGYFDAATAAWLCRQLALLGVLFGAVALVVAMKLMAVLSEFDEPDDQADPLPPS